jgi:hypothetical protein
MEATKFSADSEGLHVVIYPDDNKILIAMSLSDSSINDTDKNLAGFAIWRQYDGKAEEILPNRIGFENGVNDTTTAATRKWTNSDQAPFQKFRWIDVPADGFDVPITYRVRSLYFTGQGYRDQGRARGHRQGRASEAASHEVPARVHARLHRLASLCG